MKKIVLILLLTAMACGGQAQTISALKKYMYGIASDATEGRFTGSDGYRKAAAFVFAQLRAAGLHPFYQAVPFIRDNYTGSAITVSKHDLSSTFLHSAADFVILQSGKPQTGNLAAPVFLGDGVGGEGVEVAGRWVVLLNYPDSFTYQTLLRHRVAGVLVLPDSTISGDWETRVIRQYRFGYMHYADDSLEPEKAGIPIILVHPRLASRLFEGENYNPLSGTGIIHPFVLTTKLAITLHQKKEHINSSNVIALAPGTDIRFKNQTIVAGAHLDHIGRVGRHIYNGANDDASGCAALLGAARAIAAKRCARPVLFIFYTAEELNLLGSRYLMEHPPIPVQHMLMNINLEQVGSQHRSFQGVWGLGSPEFKNVFYRSGQVFPEKDLAYSPTDSVQDILSNTDSYSFMKKGVPSLLLGSGGFPEHHSTSDKIDLIDFGHLRKATLVLITLIRDLGNGAAAGR